MISQLHGIIIQKDPPLVVIDVQGVGYEVSVSMITLSKLPDLKQATTLLTQLIVREDAHSLYGFIDERERTLFRHLLKVNGVGPKLALTILSSIEPERFAKFVNENDSASLVKLPGVGPKTAQRLLIEMRDRLQDWAPMSTHSIAFKKSPTQEAIGALLSLGYKPQEASRAVSAVETETASCEVLIRDALRYLAA